MKNKSVSLLIVFFVILSLFLSGCNNTEDKSLNKITIATNPTWPPFESVDENSKQIVGFDIDIINAIAEKENLTITIVNVPWDSLLAGISKCQYDAAISAIAITDEREENINFSDPYYEIGLIVTVKNDNFDIHSKDDLKGKKVGVQLGTIGEIAADKLVDVNVVKFDNIGLVFQALINGQIDAVIADNTLGYVKENPEKLKTVGESFNNNYYGIAVCQDNVKLLKKINDGLKNIRSSGEYTQIMQKWIVD